MKKSIRISVIILSLFFQNFLQCQNKNTGQDLDGWKKWANNPGLYEIGKSLSFDNMQNRPITGTTGWQKYEIILDVPQNSRAIYYGVLMNGNGEVKISDLSFEIVGNDVPATDIPTYSPPENNNYSVMPDRLKDLPDGITVKHTPDIVYAEKTGKDTVMYYWNFATTVKPISRELEITEFGCYAWIQDKWKLYTVTGKPFTNKDFREWYNCKKGKIKPGKEYSDKTNWYRNPLLQKSKAMWYYIGMDSDGNLYKGTAIVDYMPEEKK